MTSLSSYKTIDSNTQLSIEYSNLYSIHGTIYYFALDSINLPPVNKFTDLYQWTPEVKIFKTESEASDYLLSLGETTVVELSVLGDNLWYGNIGHALFDGLYPLYLALVKFGYIMDPFVLLSSDWDNKETMAYDVITKFSGNHLLEYNRLDKNKITRFNKLVAGTGMTGNRVINKEYTLYGEKEYSALSLFKRRLLSAYGIKSDKAINEKPKALIIRNKRFSEYEISIIKEVVEKLKDTITIKYIDWYHDYTSFKDQLLELEDTDIHITGPGTGMMYMPFLKNGAININLGYMEHTQTNTARPNIFIDSSSNSDHIFPGWMEQSVCAGANYVSTLYYNRELFNNLEESELTSIINQACDLLKSGERPNSNHNTDAQVFIEYCKLSNNPDSICNHLTDIAFFIEFFVNEHPKAVPENLVDLTLLRRLKEELGYSNQYKIKIE